MPRDRIIRLHHENGLPTSEDGGFTRYEHRSVFQADGINVYYSAYPIGDTGGSTIGDTHQITLTLSDLGHLDYTTDGERNAQGHAHPGDMFLWLANRPIYGCWEKPLECLSFAIEPAFLARAARESIDPDRIELTGQAHLRDPLVHGIGMTLWEMAQNGSAIDRLYGETLANAVAVHTLKNYATITPTLRLWTDHLTRVELRHAIEYIHDNLDSDLSLQDIADAAGLSVHYFSRLFRQTTGQAPHQYVISQRIEASKAHLRIGKLSIAEIAVEVGFYDQSHFIRHFRATVGVNPGAYQKQGK